MSMPEHFRIEEGYVCYRPEGRTSLREAIRLISTAISYSRVNEIRRLFVDTTGLVGFDAPTVLERFQLAEQFALDAEGLVKIALLVKPELLDPELFGVLVAQNRWLDGNAFDSESEALAWLLDSGVGPEP